MRIAFYSPLKSPNHPVPSGDRLMAQMLIAALTRAGHEVEVASELRTFIRDPSLNSLQQLEAQADTEARRISATWRRDKVPELWFTYHPYYKAPDLLGPRLTEQFALPYIVAEASYSRRRNIGDWAKAQDSVLASVQKAAVAICLTERDRQGLIEACSTARTAIVPPFLDAEAFLAHAPDPQPGKLITVAMMRPGDKMDSYRILASALSQIADADWTLSIVGDGPHRAEVEQLFAVFDTGRIIWHGQRQQADIAALLAESAIYLWPGCGEAFGLAYLEAQAAGLPVVAQEIAGVPEVVIGGHTGILTPAGDIPAFAAAIRLLLDQDGMRVGMARAARQFVKQERSIEIAASRLDAVLKQYVRLT